MIAPINVLDLTRTTTSTTPYIIVTMHASVKRYLYGFASYLNILHVYIFCITGDNFISYTLSATGINSLASSSSPQLSTSINHLSVHPLCHKPHCLQLSDA